LEKKFQFKNRDLAPQLFPQHLDGFKHDPHKAVAPNALFDSVIRTSNESPDSEACNKPQRSFIHYSSPLEPAIYYSEDPLRCSLMLKVSRKKQKNFERELELEKQRMERIFEMRLLVTNNKKELIVHRYTRGQFSANQRGSIYRGVSKNGKKWQVSDFLLLILL